MNINRNVMAILTVVGAKKLQVQGSTRWKILITDGEKRMLGVCSTDVSALLDSKSITTGTQIKLKQFSIETMSNARTIYAVQEIEIVHPTDANMNSLDRGPMCNIGSFLGKSDAASFLSTNKRTAEMKLCEVLLQKKDIRYGGRFTGDDTILVKSMEIMNSRGYKNGTNECGFRVGQHVQVRSDNANNYWKRYKPSKLVGKYGYVVGVTPKFVHIVIGNMWSDNIKHCYKKNESVNKVGKRAQWSHGNW